MCGIAGIVDFNYRDIDRAKVRAMTQALAHRGPDAEGYHFGANVCLGHRRLSVIDVEGGVQPMSVDGGDTWIIYNGEVYNFRDIARELETLGHKYATRSDTEVILLAYKQWGTDCLAKFNGMFAFALWDAPKRTLFMARDRLGIKPLLYTFRSGCLTFASELRALLKGLGRKPELSPFGLISYFLLQYVPGENTIDKEVKRLEPGEAAIFSPNGFKKWKWWTLPERGRPAVDNTAEELIGLLEDSTRLRLISDVPLGAFLSGGIDSSAVAGLMSRHAAGRVKTYQVAFENPPGYDETAFAELASRKFSTLHNRCVFDPDSLVNILPKMACGLGEPVADPALIPTYAISEYARKEVTVALTGEGADELFAGYLRYRIAQFAKYWKIIPKPFRSLGWKCAAAFSDSDRWRKAVEALDLSPGAASHLAWVRLIDPAELQRLIPDYSVSVLTDEVIAYFEPFFENVDHRNILRATLDCDLQTWLPNDLLVKVDLMSMAHGLEARVPFLDHRLVEWAAGLPDGQLQNRREGKLILKKAAASFMPEEIINRAKRGFTLPLDDWFRGPLKSFLTDSMDIVFKNLPVDKGTVKSWVELELSGRKNYSLRLFALIMLGYWLDGFNY